MYGGEVVPLEYILSISGKRIGHVTTWSVMRSLIRPHSGVSSHFTVLSLCVPNTKHSHLWVRLVTAHGQATNFGPSELNIATQRGKGYPVFRSFSRFSITLVLRSANFFTAPPSSRLTCHSRSPVTFDFSTRMKKGN